MDNDMPIGIASFQFDGNLKYIYYALEKESPGCCYFATDFEDELLRLDDLYPDIRVRYVSDPLSSKLFTNTKVWITSHGPYCIPMKRTQTQSIWIDVGHGIETLRTKMIYYIQMLNKEYQYVFISSKQIKYLYQDNKLKFNDDHICVTGYARSDYIIQHRYDPIYYDYCYAPSWKSLNPVGALDFQKIDQWCIEHDKRFLVRAHKGQEINSQKFERVKFLPQNEDWDTELLLPIVGCLLTDYSSIMNDFVLLRRPIIHFDDYYKQLVWAFSLYPFAITKSGQLMRDLNALLEIGPHPLTENYISRIYDYQDGGSAERCAKKILEIENGI